ncbi:glycosyltransferase family 2 protein [Jannaschia rubra]|uniref:Putative glycosyltransferase EpsJ n=1 Tax=Jannaschia rubra TaxID=282197 RepID=A0A0M6XP77_9RHOB|nr:glycosyltransferase family 2 protein [Jannaschia rubra]CTQ32698.1 putative glycosyltransferase EpsJ [Jannaschia rubra]SFF87721.1 succinoglycan biosynthesis protein ExoU [Jannaschia rubra]
MTEVPQAAVVIAAWNAGATIDRAIDSALAQTVPVEVLVVDDASDDDTAARAMAHGDPRLRVLRQPRNMGPSAARNRAIDESRAPWIAVLDADDRMEPERLARMTVTARDTGADFLADDLWKQPEGAPEAERSRLLSDESIGTVPVDAAAFIRANLSARHGGRREMGFLKPLMSRAFLDHHDLRYDPGIRLGEDFVLYARALLAGARFVLTDPMGYVAHVRPGSLSGQHPTEAHGHLVAADRAMLALPGLDAPTRAALRAHMMEQHKKWAWRRMIDAVRASDPRAAAACFRAPPQVGVDLIGRLGREVGRRLLSRRGAQ